MAKIAQDTPEYILEMLAAVDYNKITEAQYKQWAVIIRDNIGKYIKKRTVKAVLIDMNYPVNPMFCKLINQYDFSSLAKGLQLAAVPLAKKWANENLPLKWRL